MQKAIIGVSLLFSVSTVAQSDLVTTVFEQIVNEAQVLKGSVSVESYDVSSFNSKKNLSKIMRGLLIPSACEPLGGASEGEDIAVEIDVMKTGPGMCPAKVDGVADALNALNEKGLIKAVLSVTDGSLNPKNCALAIYEVYTNDGKVLKLVYDLRVPRSEVKDRYCAR